MKHIKLFEQFVNEGRLSSSDQKKLQAFAQRVSYEIMDAYADKFDRRSSGLDAEQYTPDAMLEYFLELTEDDNYTVDELINDWNWREMTYELGLA